MARGQSKRPGHFRTICHATTLRGPLQECRWVASRRIRNCTASAANRFTPSAPVSIPQTKTGRFQLAPSSPDAGAGHPIPNFSDGYAGTAPDMDAHQRGAPPMRFGIAAAQPQ